jgi:hypothetical protein
MRVASALGVSAEISAVLAAVFDVLGDWQLIVWPALTLAVRLVLLGPLPAAVEPLLDEPLPLLEVALPLLVALPLDPPPPPPQPASTNNKEESSNDWNFIGEAKNMKIRPALPWRYGVHDARR